MTTINTKSVITVMLLCLMALTRFDHFGSVITLPDASIAAFFLGGLFLGNPFFFICLFIEAGLLDYLSIDIYSINNFCLTPAYGFLIPTYAILWLAGNYSKPLLSGKSTQFLIILAIAAFATTTAYIISSGSFYLWTTQSGQASTRDFLMQSACYFPQYLSSALFYIVFAFAFVKLCASLQDKIVIIES